MIIRLIKSIQQLDFQNTVNLGDLASGIDVIKVYNTEVNAIKKITIAL